MILVLISFAFVASEPLLTFAIQGKTQFVERYASKFKTSENLTPNNDILYTVPVQIGKTTLMMLLDTGSSDTWIKSSNCTNISNDGSCRGNTINPSDDSSLIPFPAPNDIFSFTYGLGNASG
jgi:hypothetical protein